VTLQGTADSGDGLTLPATVRVQVTEPVHENAALTTGATVAATYTEPGYSAAGLRNGNLTDKAWSNWRSGTKNASDTLTVTLPARRTLARVVTHFYRDGTTDSYAERLRIQTRTATGAWVDASGDVSVPVGAPAPAVAVPLTTPVTTDAVRVVLTAHPNRHMTVSEIEVSALAPGRSSDARADTIAVGGTPIAGFDPATLSYRVPAGPGAPPAVTALAADPYADVQVTTSGRTATVKVTSEDGSQTRTYTVELLAKTEAGGGVGGTVPATLDLRLGTAPSLGTFALGVAREYEAALAATVTSTAGNAALTVSDPSTTAPGRLVNGAFSLARPLELRAGTGAFAPLGAAPLTLLDYDGPVGNDAVTIGLRQVIGATEPLRTGSYAKTLTFSLSTTAP
jgi:hypothetical protein